MVAPGNGFLIINSYVITHGILLGETTRALDSGELRVDGGDQRVDVADGHAADGHELDDVRLREARGGDDVPRDLRWVLWCFAEVVKCEFDTASSTARCTGPG